MLDGLRVGIVEEIVLLENLELDGSLDKLDRCNIEKVLGIFRVGLVPMQVPNPDPD
jgi:hypothetical protein